MVSEKEKASPAVRKTSAGEKLYNSIYSLGEYFFKVMLTMLLALWAAIAAVFEANSHRLAAAGRALSAFFASLWVRIKSPFVRQAKAIRLGKADIARTYREKGRAAAVSASFRFAGRILFGKRGLAVSLFNYALPVISMVFLFNVVSYANGMTYALRLSVNGDFVGYISSETVFTDAEKIVQQRINYMDSNTESVTFEPQYELEVLGFGSTLTQYQLADKMLMLTDAEIEYAYGMYIGSSFYGALVDKTGVEAVLEQLLDEYRTGIPDEVVEFENQITYEPGLYLTESIVDEDSIIRLITSKRSVASYYTVEENDSPNLVAEKLGMTMAELSALNTGFDEDSMMYVGDKILTHQEEPFLAVTVTRTEIYEEYTDYETEYYNDSTRYQGSSTVVQDGVYGTDLVTANISYVNGVEVRRKVLRRQTVEEPIEKIVAVGTKEHPSNTAVSIQNVEVGQMYWPVGGVDGGQINEMMYGYGGYYRHSGIDIGAPYGTPIIAAESGTVILSQWYYGYGNCVMIQHDNGIVTVYGHASYLHVSVGEHVTQGQQIADVGQTGNAQGNHLHFEVRINDVCMNPINYLPWHKRAPGCVEW